MRVSARCTSSSWRTTFSSLSIVSFLASQDRVKGSEGNLSGEGDGLGRCGRPVLCALARLAVSPSHEHGATALGQRDLDRVEVAGRLGRREQLARLLEQLAARVATGEMRQRQQ